MGDIGNVIRQRRKELRLTQDELAKAVGVARMTVVKWELGRLPSLKNLKALEVALEFPRGTLVMMASL